MSAAAVIPLRVSLNPEAMVLGAALSSEESRTRVVVELDASDFGLPAHAVLFTALVEAHAAGEPAALMSVAARLAATVTPEGLNALEVAGGAHHLHELAGAGLPGDLSYYLTRVRGGGQRRRVAEIGESLTQVAQTPGGDLAGAAVKAIVGIERLLMGVDRWPDPIPLGADALPALPADILPGPLGRIATAVAASTQTPVDLAALAGLGVLSAATRGRWRVQAGPDWTEQLALYVAALADSGARKSAVLDAIAEPFMTRDRELRTEGAAEHLLAAGRFKAARQRAENAVKAAGQIGVPEEVRAAAEADLQATAQELAGLDEPAETQLWFDDATVESMGSLLACQGGASAHLSDEGGLVSALSGRYSKGGGSGVNLDLLLKAYDGKTVRVNRVTRGLVDIERPFLAIAMVVQPDVVAQANTVVEMRERGLLPRFLFVLPPSNLGGRDLYGPPVPNEVRAEWDGVVRKVLDASLDTADTVRLLLDGDATRQFENFRRRYEPRLNPDHGDLSDITAWASKHPGRVARTAALFALAEDPHRTWVGGEHMRAAVGMVDYLVAHARASLRLRRDPVSGTAGAPQTSPAEVLARWLLRQQVAVVTVRDCWQAMKGHAWANSTAEIRAALDRLEEHGWVRVEESADRTGRGRKPSPTVTINPKVRLLAERGHNAGAN